MKIHKYSLLLICLIALLAGCAKKSPQVKEASTSKKSESSKKAPKQTPAATDFSKFFQFSDTQGKTYKVQLKANSPMHPYDLSKFQHHGDMLTYEDSDYTSQIGVDVSRHQGKINWKKLKESGITFAFIRLGFRGYGKEGRLVLDEQFHNNINGAKENGLEVGVYLFAQAVNEKEAKEEADFVLKHLKGYELELPVVYDPESILDADARTDNVSGEQFTKNTIAFCKRIYSAGYQPMVYSNMMWEAFKLDMEKLSEYPVWYADYQKKPQTPYMFEYWQYTESAHIDGIKGGVDLNIRLLHR